MGIHVKMDVHFRHSPGGMATHSAHATSSRRASSPSGVVCRRGTRRRTARRGVGVCRAGTMEEQAKAFADAERRWEESVRVGFDRRRRRRERRRRCTG